jgi:hypothetical protein
LKKLNSDYLKRLVGSIEEIADDFLDSNDFSTGIKLRRIASNIMGSLASTDILVENLDVDDESREHIATIIKEAVAAKRASKQAKKKKVKNKV